MVQINELSEKNLPVRVLPTSFEVDLIPLGATLKGVRITPKDEIKNEINPFSIERISVEISAWNLLQGRLRLRAITVEGASLTVRAPKPKGETGPPLAGLFDTLRKLPLAKVNLSRIDLDLTLAQPKIRAEIKRIEATAEIIRDALALKFEIGNSRVVDSENNASVRLSAETEALIGRKSITVSELKLRRGDSFVVASGELKGDTEALKFDDIQFDTRTSLYLDSMRNWLARSFPKLNTMPVLKGRATAEAKIRSQGGEPTAEFQIETQGLTVDRYFVDQLRTSGTFAANTFKIPKLEVQNPGAKIEITNIEADLPKKAKEGPHSGPPVPSRVKAQVSATEIKLYEFLQTLGLKHVPAHVVMNAAFPCEGVITPRLRVTCSGTFNATDMIIGDKPIVKGSIIAVPKVSGKGELTIDSRAINYKAELNMPNSTGRSSGVIEYDTGFKIDFEGDKVDMRDKTNLANLRLDGVMKIKGFTEGDSHWARVNAKVDGTDIWFEDYWLGNVTADASFKTGVLSLENMIAQYPLSKFTGGVAVNLPKKTVEASGAMPYFDIKDLLKIFSRRVKIPIDVSGSGKGSVKVSGPLEFTKLSYELKTSLSKGKVLGESFEQAFFDVHAQDGEVVADRVMLARDTSTISLTGTGHPDGNIETVVRGRNIRLEDSDRVNNLGFNLSGIVDFEMDMKGYVLKPETNLRGQVSKTSIGDQGVPDSDFRLRFRETTIEGGGSFLGNVVQADFIVPLNNEAPFKLDLRTQEWNYAPMFASIAGPGTRRDYDGRLTSTVKLQSPNGGFWNSSGSIIVQKFLLRRGALQMTAPEPLQFTMEQGRMLVQNFFLEGDGTFLRVVDSPSPTQKIDFQVNGKLDLSLMALMLPIFEELRGLLSFAFNLRAGPDQLALLGSVYVDKGYIKIFDFPHPFEDIRGDFLFSQKKVLINSLKLDLGGGRVSADGSLELKGYKDYPLQLSAVVDKVNLNIPSGIASMGSGRLYFTGNWFPFTMKGVYDVQDGIITKDFAAESTSGSGLQRSSFLPQTLLAETFSPLEMDLVVNIPSPIEIKNSLMDGRATGRLTLKGAPNRASILGTINAEKESKIMFRDNTFDLTAGVLSFVDPGEINPSIYVTARSRVSEYDVNLIVQGTAGKPEISLSSTPPLSEADIISLLALGLPGQKLDQVRSGDSAASTGFNIGGDLIKNNPAADQLKRTTGFEVGVSSSFDETNNVAVPKITVSRKVTPKFGVSASRSIGNAPKTETKMRYQLSNRLSIVGSWEGQELQESADSSATQSQQSQDALGLDFEYRFEFK